MYQILMNKNVLLLWWSRTFSRFGDSMETLALSYLVYELTGSGLAMGGTIFFSVLPNAIMSPIAGVIIDKYNKNKIMFMAEMVRTVAILVIPISMSIGVIQVWHIFVITFVVSVAESFFEPCSSAVFTLVVGRENLPVVNSTVTTSNHIARIVGYSLSGTVMALVSFGKELIFIFDSLTFLVSGIAILFVVVPQVNRGIEHMTNSMLAELKEGFNYIIREKIVVAILMIFIVIQFISTPLEAFLPIIVGDILHETKEWAGVFLTANVIGAIVGNILYPIVVKKAKVSFKVLFAIGFVAIAGTMYILATITIPTVYLVTMFFLALLFSFISNYSFTEIQRNIKEEYLGRSFGFIQMMVLIANPISAAIFGALIDYYSLLKIFYVLAFISLGIMVIVYIVFPKKKKDSEEIKDSQEQEIV